MNKDTIQRFIFDESAIRGELLHLDDSFKTIIEQHQYPPVIARLLGEALLSVTLLANTIKFDGQITLQFQGEGPVSMLVAKCDSQGHIRGYVSFDEAVLPAEVPKIFNQGQLVVTIEYDKKIAPYQSIIPIDKQTVSQALEAYFAQSEQLPTRIYTAIEGDHAVGMLLQVMPEQNNAEPEAWHEVEILADTLTDKEMLTLKNQEILHRLFHEHAVKIFDAKDIAFECRCSVERMKNAIQTFGREEAFQILSTNKEIEVKCEYCSSSYAFDRNDVEDIFRTH